MVAEGTYPVIGVAVPPTFPAEIVRWRAFEAMLASSSVLQTPEVPSDSFVKFKLPVIVKDLDNVGTKYL